MINDEKRDLVGFVYIWINTCNGKKYIGLHVGTEDDGYTGSGVLFKKAADKYGIESFERKILYREYDNVDALYQKEFDIINQLNAVRSMEYYNLSNYDPKRPKGTSSTRTRTLTEETKDKLRLAAKGRKMSPQTRKRISKALKGRPSPTKGKKGLTSGKRNGQYGKKWYNNGETDSTFIPGEEPEGWSLGRVRGVLRGSDNPFYGKTHTPETKKKLREALTGRYAGEDNPFYGQKHTEESLNKMRTPRAKRKTS